MRIFLAGVTCIGKTTLGAQLAALRGVSFFDLDHEVERFFQRTIGRLQAECLTMASYRQKAAKVLKNLLAQEQSRESIIALPPSGLMGSYWRIVKTARGVVVVLTDTPENLVERIVFCSRTRHGRTSGHGAGMVSPT
jgi:shikimate kinase